MGMIYEFWLLRPTTNYPRPSRGDEGGELGVSAGDPRLQFQACTSSDASRNKGSRQTSEATLIQ